MKRTDITCQMLVKPLGKDHTYANLAIQERLFPEQVGKFVHALGGPTHLTTK